MKRLLFLLVGIIVLGSSCGEPKMYTIKVTYVNDATDTIIYRAKGDNYFSLDHADLITSGAGVSKRTLGSYIRRFEVLKIKKQ